MLEGYASPPDNDWERDSGDDWNFDTPPEKPTTIQTLDHQQS